MDKIRWGVLSSAKIAREKVVPALQKSRFGEVVAIASRNQEQADAVAGRLQLSKAFDSYEALLNDPGIDAVYIPLPNHLHVEWTIKALQAGKHVLCEKPVATSVQELNRLLDAAHAHPQLKVMEAFMYRFHPQWEYTKKLISEEKIGTVRAVQSFFSYFNVDPTNIRNRKDAAGGGLMDIGCYCISWSRWLFGSEPQRVVGTVEFDDRTQTDRLSSGLLQFGDGTSVFTCSTQLMPYQRVNILGEEGRIEIEIPVNAPVDQTTRIWLHTKQGGEEISFSPVDQYTLQCDAFSQAILNNTDVPISLEDSMGTMKTIEAVFESAEKNSWVKI